jgi:plastocyanin
MSHVRWLAGRPALLCSILCAMAAGAALVLSCGGGGGGSTPTQPRPLAQTITVEIHDNEFTPKSVIIQPGDTVRWVMRGSDKTHTVTAVDGSFDSGAMFTSADAVFERRFDQARTTFNYSCKSHKDCCQMQGSIRVGNDAPEPAPGY